jgi:hypothetical protein
MSITDPTFTNYVYDIGGSVVLGAAGHAVAGANSLLNGCGIGNTFVIPKTNYVFCHRLSPLVGLRATRLGYNETATRHPRCLESGSDFKDWLDTPPHRGDTVAGL